MFWSGEDVLVFTSSFMIPLRFGLMLGLFAFLVLFYFLHDADGKERHKEHCQENKG